MSKVPSSPVVVTTRFTREAVALLKQLTQEAVERAIEKAKIEIAAYAKGDLSNVPVDTGRLRASFDIASTPRMLAMKWSALDPRSGYDYALVQDIGRSNMVGKFYSEVTKFEAHRILVQCLADELAAMGGS